MVVNCSKIKFKQMNNVLMLHACFTMQLYITKIYTELIMEEVFKDKLLCAAYYLYIAKTLNFEVASSDPCTNHTLISTNKLDPRLSSLRSDIPRVLTTFFNALVQTKI